MFPRTRLLQLALAMGFLAAVLIPFGLFAQEITGNISGTVVDATGGVIPEATVGVVNLATGAARTTTTTSAGVFFFTSCYPPQYGPKSPSFARATLVRGTTDDRLYISGTASIIGHESRHIGDPVAQLEETLANMRALIDSTAIEETVPFEGFASLTHLKVYIRRSEDYPLIRARLTALLPATAQCLYLEADICRPELLLEIEAIATASR